MKVYHTTFLPTLPKIVREGLRPTRRIGIGGEQFAAHRRGVVFLTSRKGLPFWYDLAVEWADVRGKNLPPVVLRMDKPMECVEDDEGTLDAGVLAFKCPATVRPEEIEVYVKKRWVPVSNFSGMTLRDLKKIFEPEKARTRWGIMEADKSPLFPSTSTKRKKTTRKKNPMSVRKLVNQAMM